MALVRHYYVKKQVNNFEYDHLPEYVMVLCDTDTMLRGDAWRSKQWYEVTRKVEEPSGNEVWLLEPIKEAPK